MENQSAAQQSPESPRSSEGFREVAREIREGIRDGWQSEAAGAEGRATDASQAPQAAQANGVQVKTLGERILISVPSKDGSPRFIELSADGRQVLSVEGLSTTAIVPPPAERGSQRKALPAGLVDIMIAISAMVAITSIFTPIAKAYARRIEKRDELKPQRAIDDRLIAIEQAIESVAVEVERISEGQRFTTKLLADRAPAELERVR